MNGDVKRLGAVHAELGLLQQTKVPLRQEINCEAQTKKNRSLGCGYSTENTGSNATLVFTSPGIDFNLVALSDKQRYGNFKAGGGLCRLEYLA